MGGYDYYHLPSKELYLLTCKFLCFIYDPLDHTDKKFVYHKVHSFNVLIGEFSRLYNYPKNIEKRHEKEQISNLATFKEYCQGFTKKEYQEDLSEILSERLVVNMNAIIFNCFLKCISSNYSNSSIGEEYLTKDVVNKGFSIEPIPTTTISLMVNSVKGHDNLSLINQISYIKQLLSYDAISFKNHIDCSYFSNKDYEVYSTNVLGQIEDLEPYFETGYFDHLKEKIHNIPNLLEQIKLEKKNNKLKLATLLNEYSSELYEDEGELIKKFYDQLNSNAKEMLIDLLLDNDSFYDDDDNDDD